MPVTFAIGCDPGSVSMIILLVGVVFGPELLELLNNLVIFADLLIDGKQHGIEREHDSQQDPYHFGFHNGPPHMTRGPQKRGDRGVSSPPGHFVR